MTTEVEWRRKWKPGIKACPWQPISFEEKTYLIKFCFTQSSYEVILTDCVNFWHEDLSDSALKKRVKKLNPGIEAPLTRILDQIQAVLDKSIADTGSALKLSFQDGAGDGDHSVVMTITSKLAGLPFTWKFTCHSADKSLASDHLILPLMAMVAELSRRQQELLKIIQNKDKEIDDYKSQGAKVSRKHIETVPFVETAFEMNMMTSKGFEDQVQNFLSCTFEAKGQDLYRQVMSKHAWVNRSPNKASEDDSLLDDMNSEESRRSSTGPSWGNSRLPPSLQPSKSPEKSPKSASPSPSKSSPSKSSPAVSPTKDTEMMRRQALERRLELEEQKKMEKTKKKKKLGF